MCFLYRILQFIHLWFILSEKKLYSHVRCSNTEFAILQFKGKPNLWHRKREFSFSYALETHMLAFIQRRYKKRSCICACANLPKADRKIAEIGKSIFSNNIFSRIQLYRSLGKAYFQLVLHILFLKLKMFIIIPEEYWHIWAFSISTCCCCDMYKCSLYTVYLYIITGYICVALSLYL